jgi:hypothetical protein
VKKLAHAVTGRYRGSPKSNVLVLCEHQDPLEQVAFLQKQQTAQEEVRFALILMSRVSFFRTASQLQKYNMDSMNPGLSVTFDPRVESQRR